MTRCLTGVFGLAGNLAPVRYMFFLEGCAFIALAIPAARYFGIIGILTVSLVVHVGITGILSMRAASNVLTSMQPLVRFALAPVAMTAIALGIGFSIASYTHNPIPALATTPIVVALCAGAGWFFLLTSTLRCEFASKASTLWNRCRKWQFS